MKLFEHQAKKMFREAGIPVPDGKVITAEDSIGPTLDDVVMPCVLKAQVLQGGRGKAGLIQFAQSHDEAEKKLKDLFAKPNVRKILAEPKLEIEKELYLSICVDPVAAQALIMACATGGVDIETIAAQRPETMIRRHVPLDRELMPYLAREILFELDVRGDAFKQGFGLLTKLYEFFRKHDAELVEINPLVLTRAGQLVAADGKIIFDDNAVFRQKSIELQREHFDSDLEFEAARKGIPFLLFDGDIGLMCAGAGLTNTVYDLINYYGGSVSNYLEFGGPNYRRAPEAMELTLKSNPKVILVVTFGTIARADVMAQGIAEAIEKLKPTVPIVTAIRGTGEEEASRILRDLGLEPLADTEQAVQRAIELCRGGDQ
ncbi:MAG: succinate--CoA ligase subunit beta [Sedimentisphaerales bacterium]|nr:succinate--CoA ligase subunit beta [Sedimentisphaerales bacterium]